MAVMLFWFFNPAVNGIDSAYPPKNLGRFFMVLPKWFPQGLIQTVLESLAGHDGLQKDWFGLRIGQAVNSGSREEL
jgi:hypothetical protein